MFDVNLKEIFSSQVAVLPDRLARAAQAAFPASRAYQDLLAIQDCQVDADCMQLRHNEELIRRNNAQYDLPVVCEARATAMPPMSAWSARH